MTAFSQNSSFPRETAIVTLHYSTPMAIVYREQWCYICCMFWWLISLVYYCWCFIYCHCRDIILYFAASKGQWRRKPYIRKIFCSSLLYNSNRCWLKWVQKWIKLTTAVIRIVVTNSRIFVFYFNCYFQGNTSHWELAVLENWYNNSFVVKGLPTQFNLPVHFWRQTTVESSQLLWECLIIDKTLHCNCNWTCRIVFYDIQSYGK